MNKQQDKNAPISAGAIYDVPIEDIARSGNGIVQIQGFVFLVPDTDVGDHIRISIEQGVRKFAITALA